MRRLARHPASFSNPFRRHGVNSPRNRKRCECETSMSCFTHALRLTIMYDSILSVDMLAAGARCTVNVTAVRIYPGPLRATAYRRPRWGAVSVGGCGLGGASWACGVRHAVVCGGLPGLLRVLLALLRLPGACFPRAMPRHVASPPTPRPARRTLVARRAGRPLCLPACRLPSVAPCAGPARVRKSLDRFVPRWWRGVAVPWSSCTFPGRSPARVCPEGA